MGGIEDLDTEPLRRWANDQTGVGVHAACPDCHTEAVA